MLNLPDTARLTLLRTESARRSRYAKLESKRTSQRTRTRAQARVRCGASGHSQPQRNLPKALRINTAAHAVDFVDPNRMCTMNPAPASVDLNWTCTEFTLGLSVSRSPQPRYEIVQIESARSSRKAKLESKRARQRTRTRAHAQVRCGASGHSQPQRNLPKTLRINTAAHSVDFVDPNRVCTMNPAPVRRSRRLFSTQYPTPCAHTQPYISASVASAFVDPSATS